MSNGRSQSIFFRRVGQALAPYQLLEAFLKIYIGRAHLRIKGILDGKVPFHYPHTEYENAPLERLVTMFQRHSNNKALIKRLRSATKTRNYIAHSVIEHYMEHHERNPKVASHISGKLTKLQNQGYDLVEAVQKELSAVYDLDEFIRDFFAKRDKLIREKGVRPMIRVR
jgi:hypothetical protein